MALPRRGKATLQILLLVGMLSGTGFVGAAPTDGPFWWPTQGLWLETQTLVPGEAPEDLPPYLDFGGEMAMDGDTLLVSTQNTNWDDLAFFCPGSGRPTHFPEYSDGCDWVYVFERDTNGTWTQTAKLIPQDAKPEDTFGAAVDVDHEAGIIVVGNPGEREKSDTIHIFERQEDGSWLETATIHKEYPHLSPKASTVFGISVAVSGYTVAASDAAGMNANTFVFEKKDGEWVETAVLEGGSGAKGIVLAGDTLVTTRRWLESMECGSLRMALQVHTRTNGTWEPDVLLDPQAEHGSKGQTVPARLAISDDGTRLLAGAAVDLRAYGIHTEHCWSIEAPAPVGAIHATTETGLIGAYGSAWIYERTADGWVLTADIPNPMPGPDEPVFGASVAIEGDVAVIGARSDIYNGGPVSGAAYVYRNVDGDWRLESRLRNHDNSAGDWFGWAVGVSGTDVVVSAPSNGPTGTAHVFRPILVETDMLV